MGDAETSFAERSGKTARLVLITAVAVVAGLLVLDGRRGQTSGTLLIPPALAQSGIAAAPGHLAFAMDTRNPAARFYLVDTDKRMICVYQLVNEQLRLVSARDITNDSDIRDSTEAIRTKTKFAPAFEGQNGLDVEQTKKYLEAQNALDEATGGKAP